MIAPSNFRRDPAGHLGNQCGHICIGLAAYTLLGVSGPPAALLIGAAYYIGWEVWWQGGRLYIDSIEDACYLTAGAAFLPALAVGQGPGMVISIGIGLAAGAWLRR